MSAAQIIAIARAAIGTPFRHQGRQVGQALDCAGLLIHVAHELGVDYNDVLGYGKTLASGLLEDTLSGQPALMQILSEPLAGDLLLMRFAREPRHLAICAGETIIHSYAEVGQVCEHRLADVWMARIVRVYRFRDMT